MRQGSSNILLNPSLNKIDLHDSLILGSFDTAVESIRGSEAFAIYIEETGFLKSLDD